MVAPVCNEARRQHFVRQGEMAVAWTVFWPCLLLSSAAHAHARKRKKSPPACCSSTCRPAKQSLHAAFHKRARPAGLRCQARAEGSWCQGRATAGAVAGRLYWEAAVADDGLVRLGWATRAAGELGTDRHGFGYGGTGKKSHERRFEDYGRPFGKARAVCHVCWTRCSTFAGKTLFQHPQLCFGLVIRCWSPFLCGHTWSNMRCRRSHAAGATMVCNTPALAWKSRHHAVASSLMGKPRFLVQGDVVGCLLDCDAGEIAFSLNGQALGRAFALPAHVRGRALHPAICLRNAEVAANFGGAPFAHAPPPGYAGLAAAPAEWVRSGGGRSA